MATIGTATSAQIKNTPRRIYLAMENFQADFFEYTVTKSIQGQRVVTTGTLTAVTADTSKTPQGRTLRETGKKLYPNAHPGITTYMVGVYDDQTGLNGYINPNSPVFTVLNSDKPTYLPDGRDPGSYGGVNQGQGIYTRGNAYVGGDISGDGNIVAAGRVVAAGPLYSSANTTISFTNSTSTNGNQILINTALGNTFNCTYAPGSSTALTGNISINTVAVPEAGRTITLFFYTGANVTNAGNYKLTATAVWSDVATVMSDSANIAASKTYVYTFVSNGANLIATSATVY